VCVSVCVCVNRIYILCVVYIYVYLYDIPKPISHLILFHIHYTHHTTPHHTTYNTSHHTTTTQHHNTAHPCPIRRPGAGQHRKRCPRDRTSGSAACSEERPGSAARRARTAACCWRWAWGGPRQRAGSRVRLDCPFYSRPHTGNSILSMAALDSQGWLRVPG